MDRPEQIWKKHRKKSGKFLEAIYQLKNTSDCIQIDPPGPEQNLEKIEKVKNVPQILDFF